MEDNSEHLFEMMIERIEEEAAEGAYQSVRLLTTRGMVEYRYYAVPGATRGVAWVGGAGGGWSSPAMGLYWQLCEELMEEGIASLYVRYRVPNDLTECVLDLLAGLVFLELKGVQQTGVVGHSFGGAVAIQGAAASPLVRTAVPMSTQTYGASPASELGPRCSLLLLHGTVDQVLPPHCSEYVYQIAQEPKRLSLYEGTGHGLDEAREEIRTELREWLVRELRE